MTLISWQVIHIDVWLVNLQESGIFGISQYDIMHTSDSIMEEPISKPILMVNPSDSRLPIAGLGLRIYISPGLNCSSDCVLVQGVLVLSLDLTLSVCSLSHVCNSAYPAIYLVIRVSLSASLSALRICWFLQLYSTHDIYTWQLYFPFVDKNVGNSSLEAKFMPGLLFLFWNHPCLFYIE